MSKSAARKPLALAAVAASALAGLMADGGAAHAASTNSSGGTDSVTVTAGSRVSTVGGGYTDIHDPDEADSVQWAGQGGRMAFWDNNSGLYTADPDGTHLVTVVPPAAYQYSASGLTWDASSQNLIFGMNGTLLEVPADGSHAAVPLLTGSAAASVANLNLSAPQAASDLGQSVVFQTTDKANFHAIGVSVSSIVNGVRTVTEVIPPTVSTAQHYDTAATNPTISPDGKTIVFTRLVPTDNTDTIYISQLFKTTLGAGGWSTPQQVTFSGKDSYANHTGPHFESDGKTVVFGYSPGPDNTAASAVYAVDITQAIQPSGSTPGSNPSEHQISTLSGDVAVRHDVKAQVQRFAGGDRFSTAIQASQAEWADQTAATGHKAQSVTLSRSDLFADALGGAGLAAHKNGPLLLTSTTALTPATRAEIQRVLPRGGDVYLLGGEAAISPAVANALNGLGYKVHRVSGDDRYQTAVAIAKATSASPKKVMVATGNKFPDALSAGAVAAAQSDTVVVLTNDTAMPAATASYLQAESGATLYAVGGQAKSALGSRAFTPLVGQTRYETSYLVAHQMFGTLTTIGVATGADWPDALSGGAFMGTAGGPLLLVDPAAGLSTDDATMIDTDRGSDNSAYVFGGPAALPRTVDTTLAGLVSTAAGAVVK